LIVIAAFSTGAILGSTRNNPVAAVMSVVGLGEVYAQPQGVDFGPVWKAWSVIDERFVVAKQKATTTVATSTPT